MISWRLKVWRSIGAATLISLSACGPATSERGDDSAVSDDSGERGEGNDDQRDDDGGEGGESGESGEGSSGAD